MTYCKHKISLFTIVCAILLLFSSTQAKAQQIALETDAIMLGAMTPNLGIELVTGERTSIAVAVAGNAKPYGLDFSGFGVRPELKLWLSGRPMIREYIGLMTFATTYDFTVKGYSHDGISAGLGLTAGYVFKLGSHFGLELSGGMGAMYYSEKFYPEGMDYDATFPANQKVRDNSYGWSLVPMKLSVTLMWIFK